MIYNSISQLPILYTIYYLLLTNNVAPTPLNINPNIVNTDVLATVPVATNLFDVVAGFLFVVVVVLPVFVVPVVVPVAPLLFDPDPFEPDPLPVVPSVSVPTVSSSVVSCFPSVVPSTSPVASSSEITSFSAIINFEN